MPFHSPYPDVDIPEMSVHELLFGALSAEDRARPAIIDGATGAVTDYGTLVANIDLLAGALAARSIGPGDVVGMLVPNIPAFATVFHGILRAGATVTTLNVLYTAEDIASQLTDAGARTLFTISAFLPQAKAAATAADVPQERIIVLDGAEGHASLRDLLTEGRPAPTVHIDAARHIAVLPYSSGTTGRPKGVMLTHRNLVANIRQIESLLQVTPDDRVLCVLPFFHIYGMNVLLNLSLYRRAALVTMPKFELEPFLRTVSSQKCTLVYIAPPIAVALAKHPLVDEFDLSSVDTVISGAAPLDRQLGEAVARRLGTRIGQGFGMSELSPVSHVIPRGRTDIPLDSVGPTVPNVVCKIVDPQTGSEVVYPTGCGVSEPGELWVKGPNTMKGYLGNPEATNETIDAEGFLHTGDIATVDAQGNVAVVDRLKELIKYKGYQVAPSEIEATLLTHPELLDAAVIGVLDEDGQEFPKAFVVRRPGSSVSSEDVMAFVSERVSPHKRVRRVQFIDAVPKSGAGKILRKDLRSLPS